MNGETVIRTRAGTSVDPYSGETVLNWSTTTETAVDGALFDPGNSGEPVTDWRSGRSETPTLYFQRAVDITAADRVRVRGDLYEVAGRPAEWRFNGATVGTEVKLTRFGG